MPPLPAFVVKKGSKAWARVFSSMPWPVSRTLRAAWRGGRASRRKPARSTSAVSRVIVPPGGHRVAGVDGQVHQHLLDLRRVDADAPEGGVEPRHDLDVLAEERPQHARGVRDEGVEVDDLRLQHLLAAEGEELAHEARGPLGGAHDVLHLAQARVVRVEAPAQQLAVAHDHREQVVEVVGDAAREPADRLHLLRLAQLLLEPPPFLLGLAPLA